MSSMRSDAGDIYPAEAFDADGGTPTQLLEVRSDGVFKRTEVTEALIETYFEGDGDYDGSSGTLQAANPISSFEHIKLFWSRRIGDYDGTLSPIHMPVELFARLAPYARLPELYPQLLVNRTATCLLTRPQIPEKISARMPPGAIRDEHLSFVLHSLPRATNIVCVCASFTYHFPSKHMYIYTHGSASAAYDRFTSLIEQGAARRSAFLIPSIILEFHLEETLRALNIWQDKVYWNERKVGIRFDHHDNPDPAIIDYTTLSKDLNAVNTNLAFVTWSCKAVARQLDFMDDVAKRYHAQALRSGIPEDQATEVKHTLLESHAYLRSWNTGLEDRAEYLSERGKALVQTVYSGIAQRDSINSLRLASTSTKLAETSQEVAISTSRDSAVMRVIAAITIFFLPATFTATFFSTSFFSFNADLNGSVYSRWLWLYFLVSVVLTAIVVAGSLLLWKGKEKQIAEQIRKQAPEN